MDVEIQITGRPIIAQVTTPTPLCDVAGAVVEFSGVVRGDENGAAIAALEYEAYRPMAENMMRRIIEELNVVHPCLMVQIIHRIGIVRVGEAAIWVRASAKHRAEAFDMVSSFMNRLKQDVPIWKVRALSSIEFDALR